MKMIENFYVKILCLFFIIKFFVRNGRCSVSDSDEDFIPDFNPTGNDEIDSPSIVKTSFNYDSDSDFDIYKVNYKGKEKIIIIIYIWYVLSNILSGYMLNSLKFKCCKYAFF